MNNSNQQVLIVVLCLSYMIFETQTQDVVKYEETTKVFFMSRQLLGLMILMLNESK